MGDHKNPAPWLGEGYDNFLMKLALLLEPGLDLKEKDGDSSDDPASEGD